jgi:hypothetical protein
MAKYIDGELLIEKMTRLRGCSCSYSDGIIDEVEDIMSDLPNADVIPIPEGATNGDMIKAMFPNVIIEESTDVFHLKYETVNSDPLFCVQVSKKWWNAPYKKEVEE